MFLNLLCFLTCLLTWLLHQFLWPIFFLLDYLIYCSVSFALPTLTQLVHNLMSLFNSFLSFETPFPFPKGEALPFANAFAFPFAKGFLLRSPFSKGEVFWFAIAFPFSKGFFFNFPFPNGLFFTISLLPKKVKQIWAINLLQYNHLITLGKGIIQIYGCSCEFSHIFLDLDASLHYIYKSLFEIRIYTYNFIIAKGFGDIPLWLQKCWYHTAR